MSVRLILTTQLLLATLLSILSSHTSAYRHLCTYPPTLYDVETHWRIMSPDHTSSIRHYRRKVTFTDSDMTVDYISEPYKWWPSALTMTYRCTQQLDETTFIVSIMDKDGHQHYTCIEFLLRALNVVQIKFGPKHSEISKKLCQKESMVLMDAPMLYYEGRSDFWSQPRNKNSMYHTCPLTGGYVLTQWYDETNRPQCRATQKAPVPIKVESECERGEGLGFLGGSGDCPLIYTGYPFFCMANWTEGNYTYMVFFKEHSDFELPCFRFKSHHGDLVTADLFIDGICDTTDSRSKSRKHRHMILERQRDLKPDLCSNDSPVCNEFLPPTSGCGWHWASFCRYTCHNCPWRRAWDNVTIPQQYRGVYLKDTFKLGKETVTINDQYIEVPSLGKYQVFGESPCLEEKYVEAMGGNVREFVLIQSFDNGCSPRLSFAHLSVRSSSVISLRLSVPMSVDWQLFQKLSQHASPDYGKLACVSGTKFQKPAINIKELFRTLPHGWFNLVLKKQQAQEDEGSECMLPRYSLFDLNLYPETTCQGHIERLSSQSFQITLEKCHGDGLHGTIANYITSNVITMDCLAAFKGKAGSKNEALLDFSLMRIREEKTIDNLTHVCWTFSNLQKNTIYWSHVSDCDGNGEEYFAEYLGGVKQYIGIMREAIVPQQPLTSGGDVGNHRQSTLPCLLLLALVLVGFLCETC